MSGELDIEELKRWDERIREKVDAFGLECYPQEYEVSDHLQMLSYMAYSGMPAHYPHWSYGKSYEKLKTTYDHGVSGLPYEMVINSNPCIAYLMRENSLALTVLTMAHVYGHNDFFKNNFTFAHTRAELTVSNFKLHAERVRRYVEDPSIGRKEVELTLDAAHALSLQLNRNRALRKRSPQEQIAAAAERSYPARDAYQTIHKGQEASAVDLDRIPLEPEADLLLFIRDNNRQLTEWQRDLLTIVHEEAEYFLPQIETKIMNEGWASFWHRTIMNNLELPQSMHLEFLVHHNQVVRPITGDLNPYHLGLKIWDDIWRRFGDTGGVLPSPDVPPDGQALAKLFEVREVDRDASFLRRFLSNELIEELDLFRHQARGKEQVVTHVANDEGCDAIRQTLISNVGMGAVPVIKVEDADYDRDRSLYLKHYHDGRELKLDFAEKTLEHLYRLWGRRVVLETTVHDRGVLLCFDEDGFDSKEHKRDPDDLFH
ncbi:MAG: stage V sporulation protein R [Proteobacteria bacterium]|nr:MAG: stage V sporulation protein R [Pseudomonadota bacterium]